MEAQDGCYLPKIIFAFRDPLKPAKKPPSLTSNMSKHVKFHFGGIFFIGGDPAGWWVCWNVEGPGQSRRLHP